MSQYANDRNAARRQSAGATTRSMGEQMISISFGTPVRRRAVLGTALLACAATALLAACDPQSPVTAEPTGMPSSNAPVAATTVQSGIVPGSFYFLKEDGDRSAVLRIRGGVAERAWTIRGEACPVNSVVVSPDGKNVAWVKDAGDNTGSTGTLVITDATGQSNEFVKQVSCLGSDAIRWSADSTTLYVTRSADRKDSRGRVDLATARFSPMSQADWNAATRPAAGYRGMVDNGKLTVTKADGTAPRSVAYRDPNGMDDVVVLGVSYDGRRAAVGTGAGDPSRRLGVASVIDMTTGKPVEFAVGKVDRVWFQPDGTTIVRTAGAQPVLYHLAADGREIARAALSEAELTGAMLFQAVIG